MRYENRMHILHLKLLKNFQISVFVGGVILRAIADC